MDDEVLDVVRGLGAVTAIAASHSHVFAAQVSGSHRLGGVPVLVDAADEDWLARTDPVARQRARTPGTRPWSTRVDCAIVPR